MGIQAFVMSLSRFKLSQDNAIWIQLEKNLLTFLKVLRLEDQIRAEAPGLS